MDRNRIRAEYSIWFADEQDTNPFLLLLNPAQILKTSVHLQFWKILDWPIWLLIDPL